jgi:protein gp37
MAETSTIEWTDATWNPITGCSVVSPGCTNCYAMSLAGTRLKNHPSRKGLTQDTKAGPVWNGKVRLNEEWLDQPLRWKRPRMIFVCAHGDLFHESVPDAWIDRVFAVMALAPQHTFQVLTKRSARMREYFGTRRPYMVARRCLDLVIASPAEHGHRMAKASWPVISEGDPEYPSDVLLNAWPLPNVWLGVSAEDQRRADERIPDLLATPAAVRFVSAEPLLRPIDFRKWLSGSYECAAECGWRSGAAPAREQCASCGQTSEAFGEFCTCGAQDFGAICPDCESYAVQDHPDTPCLDWIIVGGESGPGARPMDNVWAQDIVDQCKAAGVAVFVKQLSSGGPKAIKDMELFPEGLRVREMPHAR